MAQSKSTSIEFPGAFSLLKPSIQAIKLNLWTFLALWLITLATSVATNIGGDEPSGTNFFLGLIGFLVSLVIGSALQVMYLRSAQGKEVEFGDSIQEALPFVFRLFMLQILTVICVIVGLLLLIVPGVIAVQRLLLAPYFLIDKNMGVIDSMKASARAGKQFSGAVWGLIGVMIAYTLIFFTILLIPLAIFLLIGYSVAPAIRYLQIKKHLKQA